MTQNRMKGIMTVFVLVLVLAGYSVTNSSAKTFLMSRFGSTPTGWMAQGGNDIYFMNWTENSNQLVGQLQNANFDGWKASGSSHAFNAIHNGSNISVTFTGSAWTDGFGGKVLTGTFKSSELQLLFPQKNGNLATVVFKSATVQDYNNAVAAFQRQRNQELAQQQAEQQSKDAAQQQQDQARLVQLKAQQAEAQKAGEAQRVQQEQVRQVQEQTRQAEEKARLAQQEQVLAQQEQARQAQEQTRQAEEKARLAQQEQALAQQEQARQAQEQASQAQQAHQ